MVINGSNDKHDWVIRYLKSTIMSLGLTDLGEDSANKVAKAVGRLDAYKPEIYQTDLEINMMSPASSLPSDRVLDLYNLCYYHISITNVDFSGVTTDL